MKLTGQRPMDIGSDEMWKLIIERLDDVVKCVPDVKEVKKVGQDYEMKLFVHMGPVRGDFNTSISIIQVDNETRSIKLRLKSKGPGTTLDANIVAKIGDGNVSYDADLSMSGIMAAVGQRIIEGYIESKLNQFLDNLVKLAKTGSCTQ
ncbi:SRPBCC domain-containing protein [Thermocladium modestius]|nr:SRPBCC domain-containing protein [Thermocladium modestius]